MLLTALTSNGLWWVTFRWMAHEWVECEASRGVNHAVFYWRREASSDATLSLLGETVGDETAWMLTVASIDDLMARRLPIVGCRPSTTSYSDAVVLSDDPLLSSSSSRVHDDASSSSSSSVE